MAYSVTFVKCTKHKSYWICISTVRAFSLTNKQTDRYLFPSFRSYLYLIGWNTNLYWCTNGSIVLTVCLQWKCWQQFAKKASPSPCNFRGQYLHSHSKYCKYLLSGRQVAFWGYTHSLCMWLGLHKTCSPYRNIFFHYSSLWPYSPRT